MALDWISRNLDSFSPFDADVYRVSRTKPFIELALMFAVYAATTEDTAISLVERAGHLFEIASRRADYTDWALRFPAEIVNYAELCAAVDELGGDSGELRFRLQSAVDAGALSQIERLPHRLLELRAALDWAGVTHSLPPIGVICAETILGQAIWAPLLTDSAIYALTHTIIFGSRFGMLHDGLPEWCRSSEVRTLLCDLMVVTSQERNWDLLGEVLLCWDCIGFEHSPVTAAAWTSFLEAFRLDGAVLPCAGKDVDEDVRQGVMPAQPAGRDSDFENVYHTTLVAILAGTVFLNKSRSRQRTISYLRAGDGEAGYPTAESISLRTADEPTPERLTDIAISARAWLISLLERIPGQGDGAVRALCHVLIASWLADTVAVRGGCCSSRFSGVASHVAELLNRPPESSAIDGVKPTLKLIVEILLSSQGLRVEPFRQFLAQSASILRRSNPVWKADPALTDKRILLYFADVLPGRPTNSIDDVPVSLHDLRLSGSTEDVDALTFRMECLTGWGTRQVTSEKIAPALAEMVSGFATQRLRNYDLISAARLLRLHEYLAANQLAARRNDLFSFLCMQHRKHGPFGWYGPEAATLHKRGPLLSEEAEFYLVATLECLWTIAERSSDGWRLFAGVPSYAASRDSIIAARRGSNKRAPSQ